jgi:hypothetical protein
MLKYPIRWLFWPSINIDGNFELEHTAMKDPLSDVRLSDGEAFMVRELSYDFHLKISTEIAEVCKFSQVHILNRSPKHSIYC